MLYQESWRRRFGSPAEREEWRKSGLVSGIEEASKPSTVDFR